MTLAIDKLNCHGLSNNACRERLLNKTEMTWNLLQNYQGVTASRSVSVVEVSGRIYSNTFKRRLAFGFTVIILAEKQLFAIV